MEYNRQTYQLRRYELVAPAVLNGSREPSGYPDAVRRALVAAGFTGWTEHATLGYWNGVVEVGTTFVIFSPDWRDVAPRQMTNDATLADAAGKRQSEHTPLHGVARVVRTERLLGEIGRRVMRDQDAVQVVRGELVTLVEA